MAEYKKVTVIKKANVYFDGKVTSRTLVFEDGAKKTLGIMQPGDYCFNTDAAELMEIIAGKLQVQLQGSDQWRDYGAGSSFAVPANSSFSLKVAELTDYCCSFLVP